MSEEDAREESSPRVWDNAPNLAKFKVVEKGDLDKAFADCPTVVEGFYTTPVALHNPMETHGNTVSWTDEGVTSWSSTQAIFGVRDARWRTT